MASLVVTVKSGDSDITSIKRADSEGVEALQEVCNLLDALATGTAKGTVYVQSGSASPAAASGTFTLVSAVATDAITIGPVTFTATSSPSAETDWEIDGADDTADAAALAAAINAHSTVSQVVTATSAAGVVTVTAKQRGVVGNYINISSADATITASGANLTGGTGGATDAEAAHAFGE